MRVSVRVAAAGTLVAMIGVVPASSGFAGSTKGRDSIATQVLGFMADTLGDSAAIAALKAREQGYDAAQTIDAATEGQLAADGTITDDSGPVAPAGPPEGVLADAGEAEVEDALRETRDELTRLKGVQPPQEFRDLLTVVVLLQLMTDGYTLEQLVFDGIIAGGINVAIFGEIVISEVVKNDEGKRVKRLVEPDEQELDDPAVAGIIRDMVTIVEGYDPLDPDFKAKFTVTLKGTVGIAGNTSTVDASGRLGTTPAGDCCLGRVRGTITVPPASECPGETAPIAIAFNGFTYDGSGEVAFAHSWAITGTAKRSGGGDAGLGCISINEAPELIELVAGIIGPFRGFVAVGETLNDDAGGLKLQIKKKV